MIHSNRAQLVLLLLMIGITGCIGLNNTGPPEVTVDTSVDEPVDVTVQIVVLPSDLNDLEQNKTLINRTRTVESGERWVLREQPFELEGNYFISVQTGSGLSASRTISEWRTSESDGIEIRVQSEGIEISTVVA
jgi:hypothetical protein